MIMDNKHLPVVIGVVFIAFVLLYYFGGSKITPRMGGLPDIPIEPIEPIEPPDDSIPPIDHNPNPPDPTDNMPMPPESLPDVPMPEFPPIEVPPITPPSIIIPFDPPIEVPTIPDPRDPTDPSNCLGECCILMPGDECGNCMVCGGMGDCDEYAAESSTCTLDNGNIGRCDGGGNCEDALDGGPHGSLLDEFTSSTMAEEPTMPETGDEATDTSLAPYPAAEY